jgi:hypothetical protein
VKKFEIRLWLGILRMQLNIKFIDCILCKLVVLNVMHFILMTNRSVCVCVVMVQSLVRVSRTLLLPAAFVAVGAVVYKVTLEPSIFLIRILSGFLSRMKLSAYFTAILAE